MGATVAVKRIPKVKVRSLVALRNLTNEMSAMRALTDARAEIHHLKSEKGGESEAGLDTESQELVSR